MFIHSFSTKVDMHVRMYVYTYVHACVLFIRGMCMITNKVSLCTIPESGTQRELSTYVCIYDSGGKCTYLGTYIHNWQVLSI